MKKIDDDAHNHNVNIVMEVCSQFASLYGVDDMLDLLAGIHNAYAPLTNYPAIRAAYALAGIDMAGPGGKLH